MDSRFRGNDKEDAGMTGNERGDDLTSRDLIEEGEKRTQE